jgi:hypothetical protein
VLLCVLSLYVVSLCVASLYVVLRYVVLPTDVGRLCALRGAVRMQCWLLQNCKLSDPTLQFALFGMNAIPSLGGVDVNV